MNLRQLLAHPLTHGLNPDDPRTTALRRQVIRQNGFLTDLYRDWYRQVAAALPPGPGPVLEIGSGAGFMAEHVPGLLTSDVFPCPGVSLVMDALQMPLADGCLRGIAMTDVLHHLPRVRAFLAEATRCLRPGGRIVMVEPWVTPWSRLIYGHLHHEPFRPDAGAWEFPEGGPLSSANGALPWIVFHRDRSVFEREFPMLRVASVTPHTPFRYLVSGGVSMRPLMPRWATGPWRGAEAAASPAIGWVAMFATIVIERA
jgi:SAM-dependent methyltransferase